MIKISIGRRYIHIPIGIGTEGFLVSARQEKDSDNYLKKI